MQETDIIGCANPNREIHDIGSGGFTDLKNVQKKPVFLGFSERSILIFFLFISEKKTTKSENVVAYALTVFIE